MAEFGENGNDLKNAFLQFVSKCALMAKFLPHCLSEVKRLLYVHPEAVKSAKNVENTQHSTLSTQHRVITYDRSRILRKIKTDMWRVESPTR